MLRHSVAVAAGAVIIGVKAVLVGTDDTY